MLKIYRYAAILLALILGAVCLSFLPDSSALKLASPSPYDRSTYTSSETGDVIPELRRALWKNPRAKKNAPTLLILHGFSASRWEIDPTDRNFAERIGAHVVWTRLPGHGLADPTPMGEISAESLFQESERAYRLAASFGGPVIPIGTSTGAMLALYLAHHHPEISKLILLAPNFYPAHPFSFLAAGPLGKFWLRLFEGEIREWTPLNPEQANKWTTRYPSRAVHAMMTVVNGVRALPLEKIAARVLILYGKQDRVVRPRETERGFTRLGSQLPVVPKNELLVVDFSGHVPCSRITSPGTLDFCARELLRFYNAKQ